MSSVGGDYAFARPSMDTLRSFGIEWVSRYAGGTADKQLTASEANQLSAANIWIVANWESTGRGGDFAQGVADAQAADAHFRACGAVGNFVIYFSIDYDVTNPAAQDAYFQGIVSVLGVGRADCYGNRALILHLRAVGLIRPGQTGWRTESTGWTGGAGSPSEFAAEQIYPPFNNDIDRDLAYVALADLGAWKVGQAVAAPSGAPVIAPVPLPVNTITVVGVTVPQVQTRLNAYGENLVVDGIEGPATLAAIKDFQGKHSLTVDGIVGPKTWAALSQAIVVAPPTAHPSNPYLPLATDGQLGQHTIKALQWVVGVAQDGSLGVLTKQALQRHLGVPADAVIGPVTIKALQRHVGVAQDGVWGPATTKAIQVSLNASHF